MGGKVGRGFVVGLGLWALGCSPNTSSAGSSSAGNTLGDEGTTMGVTDGATSMLDGTGVADGSATGTGNDSNPTMPGTDDGPATTMPPDGTDDGPMETTDDGPAESSGEPPPPMSELLANQDFSGCNLPMWCFQGNVDSPVGQEQWMQECFQASLTPPFELHQVEFDLWGFGGMLPDLRVQVYANNGPPGPGGLIAEQGFNAGSLSPGMNTINLNPPLVIDQQNICIGIASPNPGGALGVSVNESSLIPDVSYFRLDRGSGCNIFNWTDMIDFNPYPTGNWCIRGTIEEL